MAKSWQEVTQLPEFQSLPDEEKEKARDEYFYDVVAPTAKSYDEVSQLRSQFDAETKPESEKEKEREDTWGETAEKSAHHTGQRLKASAGGMMQSHGEADQVAAGRLMNVLKDGVGPSTAFDLWGLMADAPRIAAEHVDPELKKRRESLVEPGKQMAAEAHQAIEDNPYRNEDASLKYYVGHGAETLFGNILPAMGVGILTRNPNAGLALMGGQVYGEKYAQARSDGRTPEQASMDGAFYALSETVTERIPLGLAIKPGSKFMERLAKTAGTEGIGELINAVAQQAYDTGIVNETTDLKTFIDAMSSDEALREYRDSIVLGTGMGATMAAIGHPVTNANEKRYAGQIKSIAENGQFEQINDAQLQQFIEDGTRLTETYKDDELGSVVQALKAEKQLRQEAGVDQNWQRKKPSGPLQRAAEKAEPQQPPNPAASGVNLVEDDETGLAVDEVPEQPAPGQNEIQTDPEPQADIEAQLAALQDPGTPKDAVFVANGTPMPKAIPQGAQVVEGQSGTLITNNKQKAELFRNDESDRTVADILGYGQSKNEIAEAAGRGEKTTTLLVRDDNGNTVHQEAVTESALDDAYERLNEQYPGRVELADPESILAERRERYGQEQEAAEVAAAEEAARLEEVESQLSSQRDKQIAEALGDTEVITRKTDGKPFADKAAALRAAVNQGLNNVQPVPVPGGYGLAQLNPEQKSAIAQADHDFNTQLNDGRVIHPDMNEADDGQAIEQKYSMKRPQRKKLTTKERIRQARKVDWKNDDLATVIRKLGGIDVTRSSDWKGRLSHLDDPNDKRVGLPKKIERTNGTGLSIEELAEELSQNNILDLTDEQGNIDAHKMEDYLDRLEREQVWLNTTDPHNYDEEGLTRQERIEQNNEQLQDEYDEANESYQAYYEGYKTELEALTGDLLQGEELVDNTAMHKLADEALQIDRDKAEAILESQADDAVVMGRLEELIKQGERNGQDSQRDPETAPGRAVEGGDRENAAGEHTGRTGEEGRNQGGEQSRPEEPAEPQQEKLDPIAEAESLWDNAYSHLDKNSKLFKKMHDDLVDGYLAGLAGIPLNPNDTPPGRDHAFGNAYSVASKNNDEFDFTAVEDRLEAIEREITEHQESEEQRRKEEVERIEAKQKEGAERAEEEKKQREAKEADAKREAEDEARKVRDDDITRSDGSLFKNEQTALQAIKNQGLEQTHSPVFVDRGQGFSAERDTGYVLRYDEKKAAESNKPKVDQDVESLMERLDHSDQYFEYEKWLGEHNPPNDSVIQAIKVDERLNDGEAEQLLAMVKTEENLPNDKKTSDEAGNTETDRVWPEPNEHGVYSKEQPGVELIEYSARKSDKVAVRVYALQVGPDEWASSASSEHGEGYQGGPLSKSGAARSAYKTRDEAVKAALESAKRFFTDAIDYKGKGVTGPLKGADRALQWIDAELSKIEQPAFELTGDQNDTSTKQKAKDLERAKDKKRSPGTNVPVSQEINDLFANDGQLHSDLFDEQAQVTPEPEPGEIVWDHPREKLIAMEQAAKGQKTTNKYAKDVTKGKNAAHAYDLTDDQKRKLFPEISYQVGERVRLTGWGWTSTYEGQMATIVEIITFPTHPNLIGRDVLKGRAKRGADMTDQGFHYAIRIDGRKKDYDPAWSEQMFEPVDGGAKKGGRLKNIMIKMLIPGTDTEMVTNAEDAMDTVKGRLDDLEQLRACVSG